MEKLSAPTSLRIPKAKNGLTIQWSNKEDIFLSSHTLRMASQGAVAKKIKILGLDVPPSPDLTIEDIKLIGSYAINITFSDGHDRGIFPWKLLHELCEKSPLNEAEKI